MSKSPVNSLMLLKNICFMSFNERKKKRKNMVKPGGPICCIYSVSKTYINP